MTSIRKRAPAACSAAVRRAMQSVASENTNLETWLRRALHAAGLRYRIHARPEKDIRCKADIVFRAKHPEASTTSIRAEFHATALMWKQKRRSSTSIRSTVRRPNVTRLNEIGLLARLTPIRVRTKTPSIPGSAGERLPDGSRP